MKNLLLIFYLSILNALPVDRVVIDGNLYTHEKVIIRELKHPIPGEYQGDIAIDDRNRLYNLGIFSSVEIYQSGNEYRIDLVETSRYLPLPLINIEESKGKEGYSFGLALRILNFRGLNQNLIFGAMLGERDIYFINFKDPWFSGDHQSIEFELYRFMNERFFYNNSTEYNFDFISRGINLGTGFYKSYKHKFNFESGFRQNSISGEESIISQQTTYEFIPIKIAYTFDTRNIYNDPESGILFNINPQQYIGLNNSTGYSQLYYAFNYYKKISNFRDIVLISKMKGVLKSGKNIPIYNREYLGGEDFIRGYSPFPLKNPTEIRDNIQVNNIFQQTFELQWTLTPKKLYGTLEFGIDQVLFIDTGFGSTSSNQLFSGKPLTGFGIGFRFFISGMGVISMDFGFNLHGGEMQLHMTDSEETM